MKLKRWFHKIVNTMGKWRQGWQKSYVKDQTDINKELNKIKAHIEK